MNTSRCLFLLVILVCHAAILPAQAEPKKLLVVETTTGYRHGSIPTLEKMLRELATQTGEFTIDVLAQPAGKPDGPKKDATPDEKAAYATAEKAWEVTLKTALEKLSPDSLKNYDGVVFASTTGDLPIPDQQGFLDWIKAGHAFIGLHSAADTFHKWPGYIDMLGGEFKQHGAQVSVDDINADPQHPANAALPKVWTITQEEIYQFKNYDPAKVHELLYMDKHPNDHTPGHYPVSWCKEYGSGRVFYTALGHRDDIIDPDPAVKDRKNSVDIAKAYRAHVLGGIEWALGLTPAASAGAMHPLLDEKLTDWELWMGVPHQTVKDLPPGTPTSPDGHEGTPLGLGNDPKHVFTIHADSGEPVLHITGEIFGGLTTLQSYSDYHFRTEFRWGQLKWEPKLKAARDNGILFDCTGPHGVFWKVWKSSLEFQVEEKNMGDLYLLNGTSAQVPVVAIKNPKDWHYDPAGALTTFGHATGATGGSVKHLAGDFEKPNGEWNTLELYSMGPSAIFVVNGNVVNVLRQTGRWTGTDTAVTPLTGGQIQIQSEGAECEYRRMAIEPIADYPAEIKKTAGL